MPYARCVESFEYASVSHADRFCGVNAVDDPCDRGLGRDLRKGVFGFGKLEVFGDVGQDAVRGVKPSEKASDPGYRLPHRRRSLIGVLREVDKISVQMLFLGLVPSPNEECFLKIYLQSAQRSLARFPKVARITFCFEFGEVFFDLLVHLFAAFVTKRIA